jgi:hypothetical protein
MDRTTMSTDHIEQRTVARRVEMNRLHAEELLDLEELDYRQVATGDGCRSLSEWVAGRLDLSIDNARSVVQTMRRAVDRPDLREALESGVSFDRVEALSIIEDKIGLLEHLDVAGVQREAAIRNRMTEEDEQRSSDDQFLVLQPSLDESWWKLWGGLDGVSGALVDKALNETADQLSEHSQGERMPSSWYRATALTQLCVSDDPPPAQVTVHVDARHAAHTNGQGRGRIRSRAPGRPTSIGSCPLRISGRSHRHKRDGIPMVYGRKTRTIPPALRRFILHRDGLTCQADGCPSRHRLQIHHLIPWSQGGTTDPDNLITLCWYHHQTVVHQQGFTPYRHPHHARIRFVQIHPYSPTPTPGHDPP